MIEYIGRYSHKIAISNHRIKHVGEGKVSFTYKDYAAGGVQRLMTLEATEFLRRFCMHILPKRFVKIRHYGFLSSRNKPDLKMHQLQIGVLPETPLNKSDNAGAASAAQHSYRCPYCKTGTMLRILSFDANAPPDFFRKQTNTAVTVPKVPRSSCDSGQK